MNTIYAVRSFDSPLGTLCAAASAAGIISLEFVSSGAALPVAENGGEKTAAQGLLELLEHELARYFTGSLTHFTVPLEPAGTPFQRQVWEALRTIPYGQTCSYIQLAGMVTPDDESSGSGAADSPDDGGFTLSKSSKSVPARRARAVGNANGKNPIVIVIPCHRVIAADGGLGGYSGGLWRKERLLLLERNSSGLSR